MDPASPPRSCSPSPCTAPRPADTPSQRARPIGAARRPGIDHCRPRLRARQGPLAVRRPAPRRAGQSYRDDRPALLPRHPLGHQRGTVRVLITADTSADVLVRRPSGSAGCARSGRRQTWRLPAKVRGATVKRVADHTGRRRCTARRIDVPHRLVARLAHARRATPSSAPAAPPIACAPRPGGRLPRRPALGVGQRSRQPPRHRQPAAAGQLPARRRTPGGAGAPGRPPPSAPRRSPPAPTPRSSGRDAQRPLLRPLRHRACQVYGGLRRGAPARRPPPSRATAEAGRDCTAAARRSRSSRRATAAGAWPVASPTCAPPQDRYDRGSAGDPTTRSFSAAAITRNWSGMGDLVSIKVTGRDGRVSTAAASPRSPSPGRTSRGPSPATRSGPGWACVRRCSELRSGSSQVLVAGPLRRVVRWLVTSAPSVTPRGHSCVAPSCLLGRR